MRTNLSKNVIGQLTNITHLSKLDLSNNTLTGCLTSFLPDPHPELPELEHLHLVDTALNKEDLCHLLSMAYKLPKLYSLNLSRNTLTGCLSSFLSDQHPGLPELKELHLELTRLNKDDLQHLTRLIQTHKLHALKELDLDDNNFREIETDVEHLIETCVNYHLRWLGMQGNNLSDSFREELMQRYEWKNTRFYFD